MNTNIKTTNISLTDAIAEYVQKRMEKIEKLVGDDTSVQCDIELARTTAHHNKGDIFKAEIHIVGTGLNIYKSSEKEDLYAAVDEMRDGVLRELKSHRQKNMSHIRKGGAAVKNMMKGLWPWK
ncbi:MAG: ribosome-associated translation inhibitor RaiA [Candidatus Pacebacteria bacterium]|nr:ribosome-associated translation inhibitor RaiA [Candidatus Paceibacterota bacterium]